MYKYYLAQFIRENKAFFLAILGTFITIGSNVFGTINPFGVHIIVTIGGACISMISSKDLFIYKDNNFKKILRSIDYLTIAFAVAYSISLGIRIQNWNGSSPSFIENFFGGAMSAVPVIGVLSERIVHRYIHHKYLLLYSMIFDLYKRAEKQGFLESRNSPSEAHKNFLLQNFVNVSLLLKTDQENPEDQINHEFLGKLLINFFAVASSDEIKDKINFKIKRWWYKNCKLDKYCKPQNELEKRIFLDYLITKNNIKNPKIASQIMSAEAVLHEGQHLEERVLMAKVSNAPNNILYNFDNNVIQNNATQEVGHTTTSSSSSSMPASFKPSEASSTMLQPTIHQQNMLKSINESLNDTEHEGTERNTMQCRV